jgi:hypothetical protein
MIWALPITKPAPQNTSSAWQRGAAGEYGVEMERRLTGDDASLLNSRKGTFSISPRCQFNSIERIYCDLPRQPKSRPREYDRNDSQPCY